MHCASDKMHSWMDGALFSLHAWESYGEFHTAHGHAHTAVCDALGTHTRIHTHKNTHTGLCEGSPWCLLPVLHELSSFLEQQTAQYPFCSDFFFPQHFQYWPMYLLNLAFPPVSRWGRHVPSCRLVTDPNDPRIPSQNWSAADDSQVRAKH